MLYNCQPEDQQDKDQPDLNMKKAVLLTLKLAYQS